MKLGADAWIGGSDADKEDMWRWVSGPEAGTQFSNIDVPWNEHFANWNSGEPNDMGGEDCAEIYCTDDSGQWNDLPDTYGLEGYVVEYGGMPGDPSVQISASRGVSVTILHAPTVTTAAVSTITGTTADGGGNVTSTGGAVLTARGVCWATGANPTTADSKTVDGTGSGAFTSALASLSPCVTYHVRAYATNSAGTAYGNDVHFTTVAQHTVTFLVDGGGSITGTTSQRVTDGASADPVTATPDAGYRFVNWTQSGNYFSTTRLLSISNVLQDTSFTACFVQNPIVVVTITPQADSLNPQTGSVTVGQQVSFLVNLSNTGGDATDGVTTMDLPPNTEFVSGEVVPSATARAPVNTVSLEDGKIVIRAEWLGTGTQMQVRLVLRAMASGPIVMTPQVVTAEMPTPSDGNQAEVPAVDEYYEIATSFRPLGRCGQIGLVPLALMVAGLGIMKRRTLR